MDADRVAEGLDDGEEHDDGGHGVEKRAQDEKHDHHREQHAESGRAELFHHPDHGLRKLVVGEQPGEDRGGGGHDEGEGDESAPFAKQPPQRAQGHLPVHDRAEDEHVEDGDGGGLGRREHPADDAADDDERHPHRKGPRPEGPQQPGPFLAGVVEAEVVAPREVVDETHLAEAEQEPRNEPAEEQHPDGDVAEGPVDHHQDARGNDVAHRGRAGGERDRERAAVAGFQHLRHEDGADARGVGGAGPRDAGEEHAGDDVDHREAGPDSPDEGPREHHDALREAARVAEQPQGVEERDREDRERGETFEDPERNQVGGQALEEDDEERGEDQRERDRHPDQDEAEEDREEDRDQPARPDAKRRWKRSARNSSIAAPAIGMPA